MIDFPKYEHTSSRRTVYKFSSIGILQTSASKFDWEKGEGKKEHLTVSMYILRALKKFCYNYIVLNNR
jgi:hypothetical protein